jgi:hypothetical protein
MPTEVVPSGLLVIVELGAAYPRALVESRPHTARRVVAELEGEGPAAFAARTVAAAASLFPGTPIDHAVLAVNERADETQCRARRQIGRAVLYPRARTGATLSVGAVELPTKRLRAVLEGLVTELGAARGASSRVSLYFGSVRAAEPAVESGTSTALAADAAGVARVA